MRRFSLGNPEFDIPTTGILQFGWAGLPSAEITSQITFQQQFLKFFRYLFENLQSTPQEHPDWQPLALSLSLRAGALKAYVLSAVAIVEGALAELGVMRGLGERDALHKKPFGALLKVWEENPEALQEAAPVWEQLQLLKKYRNFVHLGNAAANPDAYWQDILAQENALLEACDAVILWLSNKCNGINQP